jgi:hypothetical protein
MMPQLLISDNPLQVSDWEIVNCESIGEELSKRYDRMPDGARLFLGQVSNHTDITPRNKEGVQVLDSLPEDSRVIFVNFPGNPVFILIAIVVAVAVAVVLLIPSIPTVNRRNSRPGSSTNSLVSRSNGPRPLARINDCYGQVRVIPDLVGPTLTRYENHKEVEISHLVLGRGEYDITDVRDGSTELANISGSSIQVYGPGTSASTKISNSDSPVLSVGTDITYGVFTAHKMNEVNGQELKAPNLNTFVGNNRLIFEWPDGIRESGVSGETIEFQDYFSSGDTIQLSASSVVTTTSSGEVTLNLSGTYEILSSSSSVISLVDPGSVNSDWNDLGDATTDESEVSSGTITGIVAEGWEGPLFLGRYITPTSIVCNFVAPQGLYKDDGSLQTSTSINLEVEITESDSSGTNIGTPAVHAVTIVGSNQLTSQRAVTLDIGSLPGDKYYNVRARRTSDSDVGFDGTVVDEIRWGSCFGVKDHPAHDYGDVTNIIARTLATAGAQSLKQRKLNMLCTRKVPSRNSAGVAGSLAASSSPREIVPSIFEDPVIGNQDLSSFDFESLDQACTDVEAHFETDIPLIYGATFDDVNVSLEEMISSVCETCFIKAYRRGSQLMFRADIPDDIPVLLFNHRNKRPNTEKRTVRFGINNDYDGVKVEWRDVNGEPFFKELPSAGLARPKTVPLLGLRSSQHAELHAWRAWNKMQYQNLSVSFDALQEAALISVKDVVIVADNTRPDVITGEIKAQDNLTLSVIPNREIPVGVTYTCQIQFYNGIVQSVGVSSVRPTSITLSEPLAYPINTTDGSYAKSTFSLVSVPLSRTSTRMIVGKKTAKDGFVYGLDLINDDDRYYENDKMFAV